MKTKQWKRRNISLNGQIIQGPHILNYIKKRIDRYLCSSIDNINLKSQIAVLQGVSKM